MNIAHLIMGMAFGFALSKAGATEFDFYAQLFLFHDLQLLWVIVTAIAVGIPGVLLLTRFQPKALVGGGEITFENRPWRKGLVVGSLLFGAGWGLTGVCPGSLPAMLGEGKFAVVPTLMGILFGTWLYGWRMSRRVTPAPAPVSCSV